ncbi:hypothetical protein WKI13_09190 [Teredinibacter turnerae]|uniref:hypothetical protein n=1 Tax=Teredinibacter turnerae TaxID=2426 RepID=UPI00037F4889|nr:hypothetical protein [Teredinibacter turnerae]
MKNIAIFVVGVLFGVFIMYLGGKHAPAGLNNSTNLALSDAEVECDTTSETGGTVLERDKTQNTGDVPKPTENEDFASNEDKQQDFQRPERDQLSTLQKVDQSIKSPVENDALDVDDPEFRAWTDDRAREVEAIINNIAKDYSVREHMLEKIKSESQFLNPRDAEQDPYDDEIWAYEKKQELANIIYSQPGSSSLEISSITCKQLLCEVIGKERDNAWLPILRQILIQAKNIDYKNNNSEKTFGVLYRGDESDSYFYKIFRFTAE